MIFLTDRLSISDSSPELIQCVDLVKTYVTETGAIPALAGIRFHLDYGQTLALVGPSGCGKSTLLFLMAGLEMPSSGLIRFRGEPLTRPHREIGLLLQDYGLFPWKTVQGNIELGLKIRGEKDFSFRVHELLTELDIQDKSDSYPQQLSGGQRQRVALARALVLNPALLLLDEPFAALDMLTRERLQELLASLWRRRHFGMVLVTHNIQEAVLLGGRILVMGGTPGTILADIDNLNACSDDYTESDDFYRTCRIVRRELENCT